MHINATSTEYLYIPVHGPDGVDLTVYAVEIALVAEDAGEPSAGDWKAATWENGDARLLVSAGDYADGLYMAWVKITAGVETPVLRSGRVQVGAG